MSSTGQTSPPVAEAKHGSNAPLPNRVDCGIIVVTYNNARHIAKLLASLPGACGGLKTRCVIVDNNSSDETMAILRSRKDVVAVQADRNLGYAGAINLARARIGCCSSLMILNPDLVLEPKAIDWLYQALGEPGVGITVPMLLGDDGSLYLSLRREPSVSRALGEALFGARWPQRPGWLSETIRDRDAYHDPRDVAWAGGAAILVSAACSEAVGDWDDRFFLYSEETDFAARARRCGYHVRYVPIARVCHEDGGSGRSPALAALLAVNRVRYYEKYHRRPATSLFRAGIALHYLLRSADPYQRVALKAVIRRSRWRDLPGRQVNGRSNRS
jgi:N-acetylglucosaminyl-diphospho-decaprenol L-rhamnosyltransferase